jgi:cytochrome c556
MKKALLAGITLALLGASAATAGVIDDRQAVMKSFRDASNNLLLFTRDTYTPAAANAQLQVLLDGAGKLGALFPPGSDQDPTGAAKTLALPTIWSDTPGFQAALAKFVAAVKATQATKDAPSFGAAYGVAARDCDDCHDIYRARPQFQRPGNPLPPRPAPEE